MQLLSLHHVVFCVTDLEATERFASDFGLKAVRKVDGRLYMRTSGGDAYSYVAQASSVRGFGGAAFLVGARSDLEEAVRLHGASPIAPLNGPGGGEGVTLVDPEGLAVHLVHGIAEAPREPVNAPLNLNSPGELRRYNAAQATRPLEPAKLLRLGHLGVYVRDFQTMAAWYQSVLGLRASDTLFAGEPEHRIAGFFRLDRGKDFVDHHSLFLAQWGRSDCHHISFEVEDFEAQFMAHKWLSTRGWRANWGVGRHPLGSHVFDVWFDPDGYRFETFSDTDVVNDERPDGNHDVRQAQMDLWSADPPDRYFE